MPMKEGGVAADRNLDEIAVLLAEGESPVRLVPVAGAGLCTSWTRVRWGWAAFSPAR
jgi:hypothetical protein